MLQKECVGVDHRLSDMEDGSHPLGDEHLALEEKKIHLKHEITNLDKERKEMTKTNNNMKKSRTSRNNKLEEFRKTRKIDDDSLYTRIDIILDNYQNRQAAYHGRVWHAFVLRT